MKIKWKTFKPGSGKWAYEGISDIPDESEIWDSNIVDLIAESQKDVQPHYLKSREHHLVCELIDETCADSTKFFIQMYPARSSI